jgi:hypothetical protein
MKSTQSDKGLGFDGAEIVSARKPSQSVKKNQWSGHSNDGREVNMGRGPTKGNDGKCSHSGMAHAGKMPPTSALPAVPAQGSVRDNINRGTQQRGGGREFMPSATQNYRGNPDRINSGRGPTKGNQQ